MQTWLTNHGLPLGVAVLVGGFVALVGIIRTPPQPAIEVRAREPIATPTVVVYVHVDGAGGGWWTAPEAILDTTALTLRMQTTDGQKFKLSDYRGKLVLLDFWGHW